ncbi:MAG: patatin-like phospholipase family protein [Sphingomonadaceae bacterium]|nr:patatin-like phospholipase family protein [Sphingomonadaceae bacterium]
MTSEFSRVEAFAGLDEEGLAALATASRLIAVGGGEYLVREGEEADALYIVSTGRFFVQLANGLVVAEIGAGEPVGELAFFSGVPRTADVRAMRDSTVFALTREAYDAIVAEHPDIEHAILAAVAGRLARATRHSAAMEAKAGKVIALIPAAGSAFPEGFVESLAAAVARHGEARIVSPEERPEGVDSESPGFGRWLGELEHGSDRLLLVAGEEEGWNRAISRNADALVIAAPLQGESRALSPLEEYALPLFLRDDVHLVLWRPRRDDPIGGSLAWLADREVKLHHHLGLDSESDFARVARFLTGKAVGVVLAGGGALGCAHIGVMQGLIESGVPIDFYGGTSAGAAMGGALARGLSPDETIDQMEAMFILAKAMKKITLPIHSILDPRVFDRELEKRYGTQDIADLPYNFFGVSTNLSTNSVYVHRRGPLWQAVRASGSLPTILPPLISDEGDVLVDGGVLDNIPTGVMRQCKAGPNIVVTLRGEEEEWRVTAKYGGLRTPFQLVRDVVLRRKARNDFPGIVEVMSRSMVVTSAAAVRANLSQADVLLNPPIHQGMRILDWHLGKSLSEQAREYTVARVEEDPALAALKAE